MLTYTELLAIPDFERRLQYLKVDAVPAEHTFGALRKLNQKFYNSREWKRVRLLVIGRDFGYDLAVPGRAIFGKVIVHHMNPMTPQDLYYNTELALDPEFLITVSNDTHLGIHFGYQPDVLPGKDRFAGDTKLW